MTAQRLADMVKEYISAMEQAPILHAKSLDEDYRLLADFNGYVLAGLEMETGDDEWIKANIGSIKQPIIIKRNSVIIWSPKSTKEI